MRTVLAAALVVIVLWNGPTLAVDPEVRLSSPSPSLTLIAATSASRACNACSTGLKICTKKANKCRHQICTNEELLAQADAAEQCSATYNDCLSSCGLSRRAP